MSSWFCYVLLPKYLLLIVFFAESVDAKTKEKQQWQPTRQEMRIISLMKGQWWWIFTQHSNYRKLYFLQGGFRFSWCFRHHSFLGLEDFLEKPSSLPTSELNVLKHPFIVNPWPKKQTNGTCRGPFFVWKKSWILFGTTWSHHNKSPNPTKSMVSNDSVTPGDNFQTVGNSQREGMRFLHGKHCLSLVGVGSYVTDRLTVWRNLKIWIQ